MLEARRQERKFLDTPDQRNAYARDRDRVFYTDEFRRLAEITQVITPTGYAFHNRLTHTLEVSQISRRIAEKLLKDRKTHRQKFHSELDPDVVETAALIHDLGHPPFGHIGEAVLDELVSVYDSDGFEGNAQSFRIVTRLAVQSQSYVGLNLTRASLLAAMKYPYLRGPVPLDPSDEAQLKRHRKYGAYRDDLEYFQFVRQGQDTEEPTIEAQIMDYADDIAYSIHDLVDFYRAGILPAENMKQDSFFQRFFEREKHLVLKDIEMSEKEARDCIRNAIDLMVGDFYSGRRIEHASLKSAASNFIANYVSNIRLDVAGQTLLIDPTYKVELAFFRRMIWAYVIHRPQLSTQQRGYRNIIENLFRIYWSSIEDDYQRNIVPPRFLEEIEALLEADPARYQVKKARLVADIISSFSDRQAIMMYRRLNGIDPGQVTDYI
ncbi:deoxyguanosinetriphosphate triphosphohydrolase family protein [Deinococcus roseus]|uniref:Deoxyguanosinetriphosphate triphosphohydrolase-like protein n=1 Tax=Deinococcus roseus TaxID=392414 RepID=A0ABQ2DFX6_9DEIO|nr:dNTP triphosphohydrolase [Deinococcus roseus]GGJ53029.1 deoxyguanosinetriphosphate triphosphohydrolase-like protein [Deinococcus roseus]